MQNEHYAVIDIGSNSFHMIVAKINKIGKIEVVTRDKEVLRLNWNNNSQKKIASDETIQKAISTIERQKLFAGKYGAEIKAVATSALRELQNQNEIIEKVKNSTGIEIEVISGFREAELIYKGILKALDVFDKKLLCIDIGGGSTEFTLAGNGKIEFTESKRIGAVRLSNMFFPDFEISESAISNCNNYIKEELKNISEKIKNFEYDCCIGTSGTILATGAMIRAEKSGKNSGRVLNNYLINSAQISTIYDLVISKKTIAERKGILGLEEKRADVIPAGVLILKTIFEEFNIKEMTLSGFAIREGVISEMSGN